MRAIVRERLAAGETPEEVTAYFVERYGDVDPARAAAPRVQPRSSGSCRSSAWSLGLASVAVLVRRWTRRRAGRRAVGRGRPGHERADPARAGARLVTGAQVVAILIGVPAARVRALAAPARRRRGPDLPPISRGDRRQRARRGQAARARPLRELEFEHEAGHVSDADYRGLRARTRRARRRSSRSSTGWARPAPAAAPGRRRRRASRRVGAGATPGRARRGRRAAPRLRDRRRRRACGYTEPDPMAGHAADRVAGRSPGALDAPPARGAAAPGGRWRPRRPLGRGSPARVVPRDAHRHAPGRARSLAQGRYSEAIAAYQAVLKRDPKTWTP